MLGGGFGAKHPKLDQIKFLEDGLLKYLKWYGLFKGPCHFKFFTGYNPQILLGSFLNTLSHFMFPLNSKHK